MIAWRKQGQALVGDLSLADGRPGNVVLVGSRSNANGLAIVAPGAPGEPPETLIYPAGAELLVPGELIEILFMQERAFGALGLPKPEVMNP